MNPSLPNSFRTGPDERGHFGIFGGRFVAETLMPLILDLEADWNEAKTDPSFKAELDHLGTHYTGRPSPLTDRCLPGRSHTTWTRPPSRRSTLPPAPCGPAISA